MPSTHLALLRGVNVGGKNRLPMKDLAAFFAEAGATDARTFIQSGNVVFSAPPRTAARIPALITARIEKAFGFSPPIILRTAAELSVAVRANPYLAAAPADDSHFIMFLADRPTPAAAKALDPRRSHPDQYTLTGREIYLRLITGAAKTKLTNAYFDSRLSTVSTSRNWRTATKLLELMLG